MTNKKLTVLPVNTAVSTDTLFYTVDTGTSEQVSSGTLRTFMSNGINVVDYGAKGDGTTDDTAAFVAALAAIGSRGGTLFIPEGVYYLPNGITETIPGLVVVGFGQRYSTPGIPAEKGTVIKTDGAGKWCWTHWSGSDLTNDYRAARFENITFWGTADTAGGLCIHNVCYCSVINCGFLEHFTGYGLQIYADYGAGQDASWNYVESCRSKNCLTSYRIGGVPLSNSGGTFVDNVSIKTGIYAYTGYGMHIVSNNVTVLGGKHENNNIGVYVEAPDGVTVMGTRSEKNTVGFSADRAAGYAFASRIKFIGCVHSYSGYGVGNYNIVIGANQSLDAIIGCASYVPIDDNGTSTTIV